VPQVLQALAYIKKFGCKITLIGARSSVSFLIVWWTSR